MIACHGDDDTYERLYQSTNFGSSWSYTVSVPHATQVFTGADCGDDGSFAVVCVYAGSIYTSADSGTTWITRYGNLGWRSVACNSDGSRIIAGALAYGYGGGLWMSTNHGVSFRQIRPDGLTSDGWWNSVTSDFDGSNLMACCYGPGSPGGGPGGLWTSSDFGQSWITYPSLPAGIWKAAASNSDGSILLAGIYNPGRLYIGV